MSNDLKIQTGKFIYSSWIWEGKEDGFNKSIIVGIDEKVLLRLKNKPDINNLLIIDSAELQMQRSVGF